MNRIFLREDETDIYLKSKNVFKIGVIGISSESGTSFIATSLAKELSKDKKKRIAYIEINNGENTKLLYDSLGMDKRFAGRKFFDFYNAIGEGLNIGEQINLDEKINWVLRMPPYYMQKQNKTKLNTMQLCRLINHVCGDIIICDITWDESTEEILKEMDYVVAVIDPMPSKLIFGYERLCMLKKNDLREGKTLWVVNKYNDGINKREFNDFVKLKKEITVPWIENELFYNSEYNCKIPYSTQRIYNKLKQPVNDMIYRLGL